LNEEFPVSAGQQLALITSLPFVHTARRYYRLEVDERSRDCSLDCLSAAQGSENLTYRLALEEVKVVTRFP
jgi:hypothetical protein